MICSFCVWCSGVRPTTAPGNPRSASRRSLLTHVSLVIGPGDSERLRLTEASVGTDVLLVVREISRQVVAGASPLSFVWEGTDS